MEDQSNIATGGSVALSSTSFYKNLQRPSELLISNKCGKALFTALNPSYCTKNNVTVESRKLWAPKGKTIPTGRLVLITVSHL